MTLIFELYNSNSAVKIKKKHDLNKEKFTIYSPSVKDRYIDRTHSNDIKLHED